MKYRRQEILFSMLQDCGKPSEIKKYNTLLETNKGAATVYAMRVIKHTWDKWYKGKETVEEKPAEEREFKINYWNLKPN